MPTLKGLAICYDKVKVKRKGNRLWEKGYDSFGFWRRKIPLRDFSMKRQPIGKERMIALLMSRDDAKEYVRGRLVDYLLQTGRDIGSNHKKKFCCINPAHDDKHPSMSYSPKHNKIYCGSCRAAYDTFDAIAADTGKTGKELFDYAYSIFGVDIMDSRPALKVITGKESITKPIEHVPPEHIAEKHMDYTNYYKQCLSNVVNTDYFSRRGISLETLKRFWIGYDESFHEGTGKVSWKAAIIPTGKETYTARNTDSSATHSLRFRNVGGRVEMLNLKALDQDKTVIVVEGEIDALSIEEVGGAAVGLGGLPQIEAFVKYVSANPPQKNIVLSLDNDDRGREGQQELSAKLTAAGVKHYKFNVAGNCKDANELLVKDRKALSNLVAKAGRLEKEEYEQENSALKYMPDFLQRIETKQSCIPTGFVPLDSILDGGLHTGLYVIGAISSLGKTTFCLQVADNIAAAGRDVIIVSLEMAQDELAAKSISRLTYRRDKSHAITTRGILTNNHYNGYDEITTGVVMDSIGAYMENIAGNLYFSVGVGDIGVQSIKDKVRNHITKTGRKPVVVIDYLQILAPYDERFTDKQNTDKNIVELKRMSRDYDVPVLAISSFNRESYTSPVTMGAFKESGGVEYSSDVLLALQYEGMEYRETESEKDRTKRVRSLMRDMVNKSREGKPQAIQLKVLKNRNGTKGECLFDYYTRYNYFEDSLGAVSPEKDKIDWIDDYKK